MEAVVEVERRRSRGSDGWSLDGMEEEESLLRGSWAIPLLLLFVAKGGGRMFGMVAGDLLDGRGR